MSLDVSLIGEPDPTTAPGSGIYIRRDGATVEISREEWDQLNPGVEPCVIDPASTEVYSRNITHNLGRMANEAGLYEALWRPEELLAQQGMHLIPHLEAGLEKLLAAPEHFKQFNPPNGWGDYDGLVAFVRDYLEACRRHPEARIEVSR